MSPAVEAAIIAGGVGVLTVIVALYGTRKTSQDTKDGLNRQLTEQHQALDRQLKEQREALDKQLAEQRTRTLNERFATAASQLGGDKAAAVRLAGVYAMAGLADDWKENRHTCINVLCAYLRLPYKPDEADQQVRRTVLQVIGQHLRGDDLDKSWRGYDLNFDGAVFAGGDPEQNYFSDFEGARFTGGTVSFRHASFSGGRLSFRDAVFSGSRVTFRGAVFDGGRVSFGNAEFADGTVTFVGAQFAGATVNFKGAKIVRGQVDFSRAEFSGGKVDFGGAEFSGGKVDFGGAKFSRDVVNFTGTTSRTGTLYGDAKFSGSTVDFSSAADWSVPPKFPRPDTPPPGVKLPPKARSTHA
jgi:uncharacterized protein YjbI with pentapeptide repeats